MEDTQTTGVQHPFRVSMDQLLRGAGLNVLLVCGAGVLAAFMFPPREVWWFSWLYLVPLLVALRRTSAVRASGWLMLLFGIVFLSGILYWMKSIFGFSMIGVFALASLPWILFGLAYRILTGSVAQWRSRLLAGLAVVLFAPVLWLAVEWIRCEGWYFQFSWAQFGFSLVSCRRGGVLYPYIGVYGVTFLIMLVNAAVAELIMTRAHWGKRLAGMALIVAVILPLSLYLNHPVGIRGIARGATQAFRVQIVQNESGSLRELIEQTRSLAEFKPNLIVWPEYAIMDYPLSEKATLAQLQALAREMHSTLILGCKEHLPDTTRVDWLRRRAMTSLEGALFANSALVISPQGKVFDSYHKTHPIQFFSDGVPGKSYPTFPTEVGRIGIGICYDFDFATCPLRLVKNGAEILVAPTYDAIDWTDIQHTQHAQMAQARAAETGRWIIRPTTSGVSQVIDPQGFVNSVIWSGEPGTAMGVALPQHHTTWYVRVGYRLPYVCMTLSAIWLTWLGIASLRQRRRKTAALPAHTA